MFVESRQVASGNDTLDYEGIDPTNPYSSSDYCTIDESNMIRNFQQDICSASSDKDSWSDGALAKFPQRPASPNLLESCYQEMEKKGLRFFGVNQNVEQAINKCSKTRMDPLSVNQCCWSATNKSFLWGSPPTPCKHSSRAKLPGREVTAAELYNHCLHEKPDNENTSVRRDLINVHTYENVDCQANDILHPANKNVDDPKARCDKGQFVTPSLPPPDKELSIQYEDALSVYEVYIL